MKQSRCAMLLAFVLLEASLFAGEPLPVNQTQQTLGTIQHSVLIAGPTFVGVLDEAGNETWSAGRPGARDAFQLPNGNFLITWADEVKELTRDHQTILHYRKSAENQELGTAERLSNGNTLVTELGKKPRILEVDAHGKIVSTTPLQPETDNAHMQTRMARKLPNGNYLVPHLLAFRVKEYQPSGNVVHSLATDLAELGGKSAENWPFTAIRLENGNTVVNLTHGNKTVEFEPSGKVAWQVSNLDFKEKPFADPCGGQRLPNGNTVIASYGAAGDVGVIKIFEVTRDKQLVWIYRGKHRAHEIQVLTTNGVPITGKPFK